MQITKVNCPTSKYSIKCPYTMEPELITVHNSANDASAMAEISYMIGNNNQVSFHTAIDDIRAVQGIDFNRNTWNAGDGANGRGNRKSISIEICYSKSGGDRFIKAEQNAAEYIANILKEKGWGIDRVKKHQDFAKKYCPHRTLDMGWDRFLKMIESHLESKPVESKPKITCEYRTYDNIKKMWLPIVKNLEDYAGIFGHSVGGFQAITHGGGRTKLRAHVLGGKWLSEVEDGAFGSRDNDYAGLKGRPIDAITIWSEFGDATYRVHIKGEGWLPWISGKANINNPNEYAGILGKEIDAIECYIK